MNATPNADLKQHLLTLARRFLALERETSEADGCRKRLQPHIEGLERGIFRLVVVGEVKKGKSSFINALLGVGELLPIDIGVATSVVYKILYGPEEKITVFFLNTEDESEGRKPCPITRDELKQYGTESGNPGNEKNVDFIAIELPHPLLREGIVIIDTPGVGGLFKRHRDITFQYTPEANAVFFIVDSVEAPIGGAETESDANSDAETKFLAELKKSTDQIIFIQTKTDAASQEQREGFRQRNMQILANLLGRPATQIPYFLVSSTLKALADEHKDANGLNKSGFLAVIQFLHNVLVPRRDAILATQLAQAMTPEVVAEGRSVQEELAIAQETNKEKLAEYRKHLLEAEKQYDDWISEKWPTHVRAFQEQLGRVKREASNHLQDCFSPDSPHFVNTLDRIQAACKKPEQVAELGPEFLAEYAAECNQRVVKILEGFVGNVRKAYEAVLAYGADELSKITIPQLQVEASQVRALDAGQFEAVRTASMTGTTFGTMARRVIGPVGWTAAAATFFGLVSNPVGWTVAATAGLTVVATWLWSTVKSYKAVRRSQLNAALGNLEKAMQTTSQRGLRVSSRVFQELAADLESMMHNGFDGFKAMTKAQFTKRKKDLHEAESRTTTEVKQAISALNTRLRTLVDLGQSLQAIHGQAAA